MKCNFAISTRSATIQKQKNRLDKVSLISKKIKMKVNIEYLPNLDVEVPVSFDALERFYRP
jgi:hypothetical protein